MNIIVCVKQAPEAGKGELDQAGRTVRRTGERQVVNPFDLYAMEAALRLREENPEVGIIALSMGPASAGSALRDCIALGADTGYLVTDPAFEGSDVRGTAHVLARAVRAIEVKEKIRVDAVFCGAKTVDGGTSMLGPELAGTLGLPQVTYALRCSVNGDGLSVEKEDDLGNRIYQIGFPCLVTFTKASFPVRYPMIMRILEAESMDLPVLSAADLETDGSKSLTARTGQEGAALCVDAVRYRKLEKKSQIIDNPDPAQAVAALSQLLYSENVL